MYDVFTFLTPCVSHTMTSPKRQNKILERYCVLYISDTFLSKLSFRRNPLKLQGLQTCSGDRGSTVVKVLCYKSEGRWFDPRWCHWNFSLT